MNKRFILLSVVVLIFMMGMIMRNQTEKGVYRIAILTPLSHPSLEQIERGFVDTLSQRIPGKCEFKTYNALGNKTLMRGEIEEVVRQQYDLILAIGAQEAQMSKSIVEKKAASIPIVFTAVAKPLELGLIHSKETSQNQLTGVEETTDFKKELEALPLLGKKIETVLLVYDPSNHGLESDRQEIESILTRMGIRLTTVQVFKTNEILLKAASHVHTADAVLVIKDNTVIGGLEALVKLCQQHQKLLIASDLDSINKGADLVYGVDEFIYGSEAAKKALSILEEGMRPTDIPITAPPAEAFRFIRSCK